MLSSRYGFDFLSANTSLWVPRSVCFSRGALTINAECGTPPPLNTAGRKQNRVRHTPARFTVC
jgi:hypothetical protein